MHLIKDPCAGAVQCVHELTARRGVGTLTLLT